MGEIVKMSRRRKTLIDPLDRRTAEGRHVDAIKEKMADYLGREPSESERHIFERLAMISLQINRMDRLIAEGGKFGEDDAGHYVAWTTAYANLLKLLPQRDVEVANA